MPVVLGLASSHAPSMFSPADAWPAIHRGLTKGLPQPPDFALETPEVAATTSPGSKRHLGCCAARSRKRSSMSW